MGLNSLSLTLLHLIRSFAPTLPLLLAALTAYLGSDETLDRLGPPKRSFQNDSRKPLILIPSCPRQPRTRSNLKEPSPGTCAALNGIIIADVASLPVCSRNTTGEALWAMTRAVCFSNSSSIVRKLLMTTGEQTVEYHNEHAPNQTLSIHFQRTGPTKTGLTCTAN